VSGGEAVNEGDITDEDLNRRVKAFRRRQNARTRAEFMNLMTSDHGHIVIEAGSGSLLLNSKETLADAEDVSLLRMLLKRHPEELLVEPRGAVHVRNPHGDVIQCYGAQAFLLWRALCGGDQRGQRNSELAAGHAATLEIGKHFFDDLLHSFPFEVLRNYT